MTKILLKRAYTAPSVEDGYRILVDRLWPRGKSQAALQLDHWAKALAPSTGLRKGWDHDADRFGEFAQHYRAELYQNPAVDGFLEVVDQHPVVTLVYGAKNEQANHAVVLRDYLLDQLSGP